MKATQEQVHTCQTLLRNKRRIKFKQISKRKTLIDSNWLTLSSKRKVGRAQTRINCQRRQMFQSTAWDLDLQKIVIHRNQDQTANDSILKSNQSHTCTQRRVIHQAPEITIRKAQSRQVWDIQWAYNNPLLEKEHAGGTTFPRTHRDRMLTANSIQSHLRTVLSQMKDMRSLSQERRAIPASWRLHLCQGQAHMIKHCRNQGHRSQCLVEKTKRSMSPRRTMACQAQVSTTPNTLSQFQASWSWRNS